MSGIARAQVGTGVIAPPASPIERLQPPPQPQILPPLLPAPTGPIETDTGPRLKIVGVEIEGATKYPAVELEAMTAAIRGQTVPQGQIAEIVRQIQAKYRNDGYFLTAARGTLEPAEDGVRLRVRVIEGYIGTVKIEGDIGPAGVLVYDFLNKLTAFRPVNISDVERYLLLAQNIPGVSVRAVLRPSSGEPGAVELVGQVGRKAFGGIVTFDNRGSPSAGPEELLVGANANSFTSLGERSEVVIFNTPFTSEQIFGQAAIEGFIGTEGMKLRGYVGYGPTSPGDTLKKIDYKGRLLIGGASVTYPVIRTRALSLTGIAAFDLTHSEIDSVQVPPIRQRQSNSHLRIARFGSTVDFQDELLGPELSGANSVNLTVSKGLVPESHGDLYPARAGNINDFVKFTGEITRVQSLAAWDNYQLALKLAGAGQWTGVVLPPSEKFYLGGAQYGRGFFSGQVTGDRVVAGTVELQLNTDIQGGVGLFGNNYEVGLQYYGFYDAAQTWDRDPGGARSHLESIGVGVRAAVTSNLTLQLEGVQRFTLRPVGSPNVSLAKGQAVYVRFVGLF